MNAKNIKKISISLLLFSLSLFVIGQNLNKPFWGEHDWNGVRYGNIARNYLRYGFRETKFGQVENSGFVQRNEFEYYTHYPPLLPLLIALSYKIFGISEWSTRIIPLIATSGVIVLIFLIGTIMQDYKMGLTASLIALVTPMVLYFGKNPVHEPVVLFFILLALWGYLKKYRLIFLLGLILAEITAWAGYLLIPAITVSLILKKDKQGIKEIIPFWLLSAILFSTHLIHVIILTGSISGGKLFEALFQRTGVLSEAQPEEFNLFGFFQHLRLWFSSLYTITLCFLVGTWIVIRRAEIFKNDSTIITLAMVGIIYTILFSNAVFIHNYLIFYFLPFLVLAGAWTINNMMKLKIFKRIYFALPIMFLLFIFFERRSFVEALDKSDTDKLAVEVGRVINKQTKYNDVVLISPLKFSYSSDKFLRFYSDRKIVYSEADNIDYDVKVLVNQQDGKFEIIKR